MMVPADPAYVHPTCSITMHGFDVRPRCDIKMRRTRNGARFGNMIHPQAPPFATAFLIALLFHTTWSFAPRPSRGTREGARVPSITRNERTLVRTGLSVVPPGRVDPPPGGDPRETADGEDDIARGGGYANPPFDVGSLEASVYGPSFLSKLADLERYKRRRGDCLVPRRYEPDPPLGNWVNKQRQLYKKYCGGEKSPLTPTRVEILERMGFAWEGNAAVAKRGRDAGVWTSFLEKLREHKGIEGHCRVDGRTKLGSWVSTQRKEYRKHLRGERSALTPERISALESLGFEASTRYEDNWSERIRQLSKYKEEYGDCLVPSNYPPELSLGRWVNSVRKKYKLMREGGNYHGLNKGRIDELEGMGFVWSVRDYQMRERWGDNNEKI